MPCLQRLSVDDTSRQIVLNTNHVYDGVEGSICNEKRIHNSIHKRAR